MQNTAVKQNQPDLQEEGIQNAGNLVLFPGAATLASDGFKLRNLIALKNTSAFWSFVAYFSVITFGSYLFSDEIYLALDSQYNFPTALVIFAGFPAMLWAFSLISMLFANHINGKESQIELKNIVGSAMLVMTTFAAYFLSSLLPEFIRDADFKYFNSMYLGIITVIVSSLIAGNYIMKIWKEKNNSPAAGIVWAIIFATSLTAILRFLA